MDLIESAAFVREQLERNRGQWKRVAAESGVPYKTIKNFMQREDSFPRVPTLDKLHAYFRSSAPVTGAGA
jgi:hypothetical protein